MPKQFDVFVNPLRDRAAYPLLVVLQSPFADLANTRVVAPAVPVRQGTRAGGILMPRFALDGSEYSLHIFQLTSVQVTALKRRVGNIAEVRDAITRALDHLFHDNA